LHAPQWALSVSVSTHLLLQMDSPGWQVSWQVPEEHTLPDPHPTPQKPQFSLSVSRLTHLPVHSDSPCWQESEHVPFEQRYPEGQALPQVPQFASSVRLSTHLPLQLVSPCWQLRAHCPKPLQTWPGPHSVPGFWAQGSDAPQWVWLVPGSMQVPPQLMKPCWQVSVHCPEPSQISPGSHVVPGF
jgi:hypothetical protein